MAHPFNHPNFMSNEESEDEFGTLENFTTRAQEFGNRAQERAQDALQVSKQYVKENPVPIIVGALLVGAVLGVLISQRDRDERKAKDTVQAARDLVETAYGELLEKLPKLKKQYSDTQDHLLEQAQDLGKKIKMVVISHGYSLS